MKPDTTAPEPTTNNNHTIPSTPISNSAHPRDLLLDLLDSRLARLDENLERAYADLRERLDDRLAGLRDTIRADVRADLAAASSDARADLSSLRADLAATRADVADLAHATFTRLDAHEEHHRRNEHRWDLMKLAERHPMRFAGAVAAILAATGLLRPEPARALAEALAKLAGP